MFPDMLSCICLLKHISKYSFIYCIGNQKKKDRWAKWARMLKNTLTHRQLCSLTCFLVFACLNKPRYTSSLILHKLLKYWKRILQKMFFLDLFSSSKWSCQNCQKPNVLFILTHWLFWIWMLFCRRSFTCPRIYNSNQAVLSI